MYSFECSNFLFDSSVRHLGKVTNLKVGCDASRASVRQRYTLESGRISAVRQ